MKKIVACFSLILSFNGQLLAQESYKEVIARFNTQLERMIEVGSVQPKSETKTTEISASFALDNAQITNGITTDYLEFDINIKADASGVFFSNALFRIDYSGITGQSEFGTNIGENGNIELTYGPLFSDLNTYEPDLYMDVDTQQVALIAGIRFFPLSGSFNRVEVPQTYVQLLHIKIEIVNCSQEIAVTYHDDLISLPNAFWTYNDALDGDFFSNKSFENVTFEDESKLKDNPLESCTITGIDSQKNNDIVELFPNPAMDYLKIQSASDDTHFEIFNRAGVKVFEGDASRNKNVLDISHLKTGYYILKTITGSDVTRSRFCKL